ncbi:MAG TPA: trehalose-6-phosphate synthase [Aquihabitans sp.]|jgi:trehalose 6-phosphate synthase|nr:trehalose-6-phosphate synthase [Aquihabitans sp.]
MAADRPLVIVSNRGPVTFRLDDDGVPRARRGAGGLVSGVAPLVRGTDTLWVAAAMADGDRVVAAGGATTAEGFRVRLLAFDDDTWRAHYDAVCNEALWFAHHGLFDPVYEPSWPAGWVEGPWAAHRRVNAAFADALATDAPDGAVVLIQDYHLCLVAATLRDRRPDLRLVHFSHTPFATPLWLRTLPEPARRELLEGMARHHACGFHTQRWADDFTASCTDLGVAPPERFVASLGPDPDDLAETIASEACAAAAADLEALVGDRRFLVRVDRIELSKNVLRGFDAFEALLEAEPHHIGRIVFGAFVYPSRAGVAAYDRYRAAVEARVAEINARHGTDTWTPIVLDLEDDYPRSMAALARADVVLVNPIRDGLNLVAKEAMVVNDRHGQLVLSPEAGAWDELGDAAFGADPFDVGATATALAAALHADDDERARRWAALRAASLARSPADWLADQLAAAG